MEAREREPTAEPAPSPGRGVDLSAPALTVAGQLLGLQRTAGNRAVGRLLARRAAARRIARMEVWRGEAIGGGTGSGGLPDDFGPGLYLATTADLGRMYAITRAGDDPALRSVLGAEIPEAALGRVLDLTTDPRWDAFLAGPFSDIVTTPVHRLLPPTGPNEGNYYELFVEFLHRNGINIEDYDAIKGPELVRGGVQICVRSPVLGWRIRSVMAMVEKGAQVPPWNPKTGFGGAPPPVLPASAKLTEDDIGGPVSKQRPPTPAARPAAPKPGTLSELDLRPPAGVKPAPKGLSDLALVPPKNLKPGPKGGGDGGGAPPAGGGAAPPPAAGSGGAVPPAGSTRGATTASTPGWHVQPMATPLAPDAYGDAKSGAIGGAIDLAFAAYNRHHDALEREREKAERARLEVEIDRMRDQHPEWGALLLVHKRQTTDLTGFSQGALGPRFVAISVGYGRDAREAEMQMGASAFAGGGPAQRDFVASSVWIPALRPVDPPPPPPPFPSVRVATFTSSTPLLTDVAWALTPFGFNDVGTMPLDVPPGVVPRFHVLALPAQMESAVPSAAHPGVERGAIDQATVADLPVVRLDVFVPFDHDSAAAIFPADAATAALFASVPATRHSRLLTGVRNFDLVRWVSPEQISVLER